MASDNNIGKSISLKKRFDSKVLFLICAWLVIYCPFLYVQAIGHYVEDTAIQIKVGMDCLEYHNFIPVERYSWHENLTWPQHEIGWYYIVGIAYKLFGLLGVIGVAAIFNYSSAALAFKYNYDHKVHPLIIALTAGIARIFSFPNYNARPNLFSTLAYTYLLITMMSKKSDKTKCITFVVVAWLASWFHGGMMPLFFASFAVFAGIELVFKNYKTAVMQLVTLVIGFVASLLNPIGINAWIYPFKMTGSATEFYWSQNFEWQPKVFSMWEMLVILLILVGFAVDKRLRDFDKNTIIRLCFFCMFIIMSCKHCRFMNYAALVMLLFCAEELQVLLGWINEHVFKIRTDIFDLSDASNYILAAFCVGFAGFFTITSLMNYFPTNTLADASAIEAYDMEVIDFVKEKGYSRIYNSFDTGTWLAFYDIPVHIDNRADLYLPQYSGVDYISNQMVISNIRDMDSFCDMYSPDAIVLELFPGTTDEYFIDDLLASDRYTPVYDHEYTSVYDPNTCFRWMVFECNY